MKSSSSSSSSPLLLLLLLSCFLSKNGVFGFVIPQKITTTTSSTSTSFSSSSSYSTTTRLFGIKWDPTETAKLASEEKVFVEFPTPAQRKTLKKEITKLQARKQLPTLVLSKEDGGVREVVVSDDDDDEEEDDSSLFQPKVLQQIWDLFYENEMEVVQVRGLSRHDKKFAFAAAEQLCWELEDYHQHHYENLGHANDDDDNDDDDDDDNDDDPLEVTLLSTKGHAAILYCPMVVPSLDHPNKIVLRTSVGQKNTWKARIKAPRDNRGQIIPKELREEYYKQKQMEEEEGEY